jgi:hypothetical protein
MAVGIEKPSPSQLEKSDASLRRRRQIEWAKT